MTLDDVLRLKPGDRVVNLHTGEAYTFVELDEDNDVTVDDGSGGRYRTIYRGSLMPGSKLNGKPGVGIKYEFFTVDAKNRRSYHGYRKDFKGAQKRLEWLRNCLEPKGFTVECDQVVTTEVRTPTQLDDGDAP